MQSFEDAATATTGIDVPGRVEWADSDTAVVGINHLVGSGANAQSITMTWAEPATGGTDITGYEIQVWDGSKWVQEDTLAAADLTTLSYTADTGLNPGAMYHYIIRASNSQGAGPWSTSLSATTRAAAPGTPALTARSGGRTTVILEWTVPNSNGSPITDYELQRWVPRVGDTLGAWGTNDLLVGGATTQTLFTDGEAAGTALASGTTYYYRIRAMNAANDNDTGTDNDGEGAWSADTTSGRSLRHHRQFRSDSADYVWRYSCR